MTGCAVTVAWRGSPQPSQAASVSLSRQLNALGTPRSGNGARSATRSLVERLLKTSLDTLAEAMEGTVVHPANPKTALSVRAMLTASIGALELLPDRGDPFSIRDWIENDSGSGFLFLTSRGDQHASLRGLISTWLEIAVNALLSFPRDDGRRIWIVLDESPALHQLPSPAARPRRKPPVRRLLRARGAGVLRSPRSLRARRGRRSSPTSAAPAWCPSPPPPPLSSENS